MAEAWLVIRNVKIVEAAYAGPPGSDQIVGILTANKIIDALNAAGYIIAHHSQVKTERAPESMADRFGLGRDEKLA